MPTVKSSRPTIRDVARKAGVSHQTVSRVLNAHPRVAPETRGRVLRAMDARGYERNLAAQMLTRQRSQLIQVLTVDGKFPFDVPLPGPARGDGSSGLMHTAGHSLLDASGDIGYSAIYSECTAETLGRTLEIAAARMVDGIFMYAPKLCIDDAELLRLCRGIPLVRRDFVLESKGITWVGYDQIRAAQMATEHLIELGHRQIAVVTGTLQAINARWRYETWRKTLIEHGLEPGPSAHGDYTTRASAMQTGYDGMCQILRSGEPFTAVVVANDHMALGVLHALRQHGLHIPGDVSVVSFDDAPHARFLDPPLTTVAFDFDLQNRLAFQFLLELIRNPEMEPHQHIVLPDLIVRQSTRALY